jgi:hypothetical protein
MLINNPGIADGSVTTAKIADGAVTQPKLAAASVYTSNLADGSVTTSKIAAGAVTTSTLAYARSLVASSNIAIVPSGVYTGVSFDIEIYDIGGCHDPGVNPSRLTVPAGMNWARVTANIAWATVFSADCGVQILKNGSSYYGVPWVQIYSAPVNIPALYNLSSSWLQVVPGDYFELRVVQYSGSNKTLSSGVATTFSIDCMG